MIDLQFWLQDEIKFKNTNLAGILTAKTIFTEGYSDTLPAGLAATEEEVSVPLQSLLDKTIQRYYNVKLNP